MIKGNRIRLISALLYVMGLAGATAFWINYDNGGDTFITVCAIMALTSFFSLLAIRILLVLKAKSPYSE